MSEPRSADALIDALAMGLRHRVGELRRSRELLASFAFREGDGDAESGGQRPTVPIEAGGSLGSDAEPPTVWSIHLLRVLRTAADPPTLELLGSLRNQPRPFPDTIGGGRAGGDRLAAATWLGDLAATGLVSHELATDRVELTPLGEAIVDLVDEIAARAGQGRTTGPRTIGAPTVGGPSGAGR